MGWAKAQEEWDGSRTTRAGTLTICNICNTCNSCNICNIPWLKTGIQQPVQRTTKGASLRTPSLALLPSLPVSET